jgi:hypothetical protein
MAKQVPPAPTQTPSTTPSLKEALDAYRRRHEAREPQNPRITLSDELKQRLVAERDKLAGLDLRNTDLTNFGDQLRGVNLEDAELSGADLDGTLLWDANLRNANLPRTRGHFSSPY